MRDRVRSKRFVCEEHKLSFLDYSGDKDYNAPCPDGWKFSSHTKVCTAPNEYQGPCGYDMVDN